MCRKSRSRSRRHHHRSQSSSPPASSRAAPESGSRHQPSHVPRSQGEEHDHQVSDDQRRSAYLSDCTPSLTRTLAHLNAFALRVSRSHSRNRRSTSRPRTSSSARSRSHQRHRARSQGKELQDASIGSRSPPGVSRRSRSPRVRPTTVDHVRSPTHQDPSRHRTDQSRAASCQHNVNMHNESEHASGAPKALILRNILRLLPEGYLVSATCPVLDKGLAKQSVAWKWEGGWEMGTVIRKLGARRRQDSCYVEGATFLVRLNSDKHPREVALTEDRYSSSDRAPAGSWALFVLLAP